MEIRDYLIGGIAALAVSFGAGVYVGFRHCKDIAYALAKAEKTAYSVDMELRKILRALLLSVQRLMRTFRESLFLMQESRRSWTSAVSAWRSWTGSLKSTKSRNNHLLVIKYHQLFK